MFSRTYSLQCKFGKLIFRLINKDNPCQDILYLKVTYITCLQIFGVVAALQKKRKCILFPSYKKITFEFNNNILPMQTWQFTKTQAVLSKGISYNSMSIFYIDREPLHPSPLFSQQVMWKLRVLYIDVIYKVPFTSNHNKNTQSLV